MKDKCLNGRQGVVVTAGVVWGNQGCILLHVGVIRPLEKGISFLGNVLVKEDGITIKSFNLHLKKRKSKLSQYSR